MEKQTFYLVSSRVRDNALAAVNEADPVAVLCAADGCLRPLKYTGARARTIYCDKHQYRFLRHGDPLGGRTPPGETDRFIREVIASHVSDACLIWPYARNSSGYGHINRGGKYILVSRIACEMENGPPPSEDLTAAHSCGKGDLGCCNKKHLRWATFTENSDDKRGHGTHLSGEACWQSILTAKQVEEIRGLKGRMMQREIAALFGTTQSNVSQIHRGRSWK